MDEDNDIEEPIHLSVEGYHRSIFLIKSSIDYISVPAHKYRRGSLLDIEEVLNEKKTGDSPQLTVVP